MQHNIYLYIMVSALVSFAVRAVPLTLIRKKIENPFLKSFLFYVPYVTLSVMTFPAIVETTAVPIAGVLALIAGIIAARKGVSMFLVAVIWRCGRFLVPVPRANAGSGTGNNMEEQLTHLIMTDMAIRQQ